jgi:hypothetical protein
VGKISIGNIAGGIHYAFLNTNVYNFKHIELNIAINTLALNLIFQYFYLTLHVTN